MITKLESIKSPIRGCHQICHQGEKWSQIINIVTELACHHEKKSKFDFLSIPERKRERVII
jgi:hypothetical protein